MVSDLQDNKSHARSHNSFLLPPPFVAHRRAGKKSIFTPRALLPSSSSPLVASSPKPTTSSSSRPRPAISSLGARLPRTSLGTVAGRVGRIHRNARHSSPQSPIRAQILRRDFLADDIESLASWSSSPVHTKLGRQPDDDANILRPLANRRDGLGRPDPSPMPSSPASFVTAVEILPTPSPFPLSASNTPTPPPSERLISSTKVSSPDGNATASHQTHRPLSPSGAEPSSGSEHSSLLRDHNSWSPEALDPVNSDHPNKMPLSLIHSNIPYDRAGCFAVGSPQDMIRRSQSSLLRCGPTRQDVFRFGDNLNPFNGTYTEEDVPCPSQGPADPSIIRSLPDQAIDDSVTLNYIHSPAPWRQENHSLALGFNDPHHPYSGRAWRAQGTARPVHLGFGDPPPYLDDLPRATVEPVWTDEQIRAMFTTSDDNIAERLSPRSNAGSLAGDGLQTPGVGTTYQRWYAGKENLPPALRATMTRAERLLWDEPPAAPPAHRPLPLSDGVDEYGHPPREGHPIEQLTDCRIQYGQGQNLQGLLHIADGETGDTHGINNLPTPNAVSTINNDKKQVAQTKQKKPDEPSPGIHDYNGASKVRTPKCSPPQKMAKVYKLSEDTIHKLRVMPGLPDKQAILFAAAEATEFHKYPVHPDQRAFFTTIYHDTHLPYPIRIDGSPNSMALPHSPAHKILLLVQTDLGGSGWPPSRLNLNARKSLIRERVQMYKTLETILRCAVDVLGQRKDAQGVRNALYLLRSVSAGSWDEPSFQLLQLDNIGIKRVERLKQAGVTTVRQLKTKEFYDLERLLSRNPPFGHQLKHRLMHFPDLEMRVNFIARATDKPDMVVVSIVFQFANQITDTRAQAVLALTGGGVVTNIPQQQADTGSSGITLNGVPRWQGNTAPWVTFVAERTKDKHLLHFWRGNLKVMKGEGKTIVFGCRADKGDTISLEMACEAIAGTTVSQTMEAP